MKISNGTVGFVGVFLFCGLFACDSMSDRISGLSKINDYVFEEHGACSQYENLVNCNHLIDLLNNQIPNFKQLGLQEIVIYNHNYRCIAYKLEGGKNYFWYYLKVENIKDYEWFIYLEQFRDGLIKSEEKQGWIINKMAKDF